MKAARVGCQVRGLIWEINRGGKRADCSVINEVSKATACAAKFSPSKQARLLPYHEMLQQVGLTGTDEA
jgi:hypothetical protein